MRPNNCNVSSNLLCQPVYQLNWIIDALIAFAPGALTRIIHEASTAAADPAMSTALRSFRLLDVLSSTPAGPSVARLVSMPVCAASL
jgi:uncharacterized membrane protein AbrB (regulator of aidB expression)